MHITFVKKRLANGEFCAKCLEVEARLQRDGHRARIDETLIADEADAGSPGQRLAQQHGVERAPFFVVRNQDATAVHSVCLRFVREGLNGPAKARQEAEEILKSHLELDYL